MSITEFTCTLKLSKNEKNELYSTSQYRMDTKLW